MKGEIKTHGDIAKIVNPVVPCNSGHLTITNEGLQCLNCGAWTSDFGGSWHMGKGKNER